MIGIEAMGSPVPDVMLSRAILSGLAGRSRSGIVFRVDQWNGMQRGPRAGPPRHLRWSPGEPKHRPAPVLECTALEIAEDLKRFASGSAQGMLHLKPEDTVQPQRFRPPEAKTLTALAQLMLLAYDHRRLAGGLEGPCLAHGEALAGLGIENVRGGLEVSGDCRGQTGQPPEVLVVELDNE
jgi:hypothetical protein